MKARIVAGALLASCLLFNHGDARAEDIDLFVQPSGAAAGIPNVLIIVDNTANWSQNVDGQAIVVNELAALMTTLQNIPVNDDGTAVMRVGLMLYTETGGSNNNVKGGYVRAAIRDMTEDNKDLYTAMFNGLQQNGDKSDGGKAGLAMAEAWLYYDGESPYSGNGKVKTDYTGNTSGVASSKAIYDLAGNAIDSKNGSPYNSPVAEGNCGRNYIIFISNGPAQDNSSDIATGNAMLATEAAEEGESGATDTIPISPSGSQNNPADEWARFMRRSSLGIITYTIDVDRCEKNAAGECISGFTGQKPGWTALLKSMASVSNGHYFDVTSGNGGAEIEDALNRTFSEIQAVNSVFAAVSLPANITTQGTFLNQVYIGQFRPDADALPRWPGNLKQYKLGILNGELRTLDADDNSAINPGTGFLTECGRSFWTPAALDTYWSFYPQGDCNIPNTDVSNSPDGNIVEKGAQAHRLRSATSRTMKTCSPVFASCTAVTDFNSSLNAAIYTPAMFGAADETARNALINWARGVDIDDEQVNGNTTEMRPTVHGDVLHARPIAINYGPEADPDVVVFYGGNDGVLRAVNGNRNDPTDVDPNVGAIGGFKAGDEMWSFMAPEFYGLVERLRDNDVPISFEGSPAPPPDREPKPYGFDGPIVSYEDGTTRWVFATVRRGGRFMYAFDVSAMASGPGVATLKWKVGCPNQGDDSDCTSGYDGIGQTWSAPHVLKTSGYTESGNLLPMLVFGGGYSTCEDGDPHTCDSSSKGRTVYVVDADDGAILQSFTTDRPVAADVFVVPDTDTGLAKFVYVADTGGNLYRISGATANAPFDVTAPGSWTMTKIASLGCDGAADTSPSFACPMNRKFLSAPDVVEKDGLYYLLIGSGDREKPLQAFDVAYEVENKFFMVKDNPSDTEWLTDETGTCGSAIICLQSLVAIENGGEDPDPTDLAAKKGWALDLRDHEQAVTSAITVFGVTTFSTHTPTLASVGSCASNLGTARVYNVRFSNAAAIEGANNRDSPIAGGGLPSPPVAGMVELDDGTIVPFCIGCDSASPLEASLPTPPSAGTQPKSLTYWLTEK